MSTITTHRGGHALQRRIGRKRPGTPQRRRGLLRTQGHRRRRADSDRATSDPRATQTRCRPVAPSRATQPSAAARQPEGATPSTPGAAAQHDRHRTDRAKRARPPSPVGPTHHAYASLIAIGMARHKREWVSKRSLRWLGGRDRVRGEAITPRAVIGPSLGRHCDRRARAGARTKAIAASRGRARSVLGASTSDELLGAAEIRTPAFGEALAHEGSCAPWRRSRCRRARFGASFHAIAQARVVGLTVPRPPRSWLCSRGVRRTASRCCVSSRAVMPMSA